MSPGRSPGDSAINPERPTKTLRFLERGLLLAGVALLLTFFLAKGWGASERAAGLEAFEQARAAAPGDTKQNSGVGPSKAGYPAAPDTSLWSAKRIEAYLASLQVDADAPHAILTIEHLNIRVPVYNGASDFNLNRGVARIKGTGRVGEVGNLGIAGHRDGFFRPLKDIKIGDTFAVETYLGTTRYRVSSIEIIDPTQLEVLAPTDAPTVTLVTCYPFYFVGNAPKRFIVKGEAINHQVRS